MFRQAAIVDKILKGAKAGEIPVGRPKKSDRNKLAKVMQHVHVTIHLGKGSANDAQRLVGLAQESVQENLRVVLEGVQDGAMMIIGKVGSSTAMGPQ